MAVNERRPGGYLTNAKLAPLVNGNAGILDDINACLDLWRSGILNPDSAGIDFAFCAGRMQELGHLESSALMRQMARAMVAGEKF